ncbi:hypothetical protein [Neobacillus rhizophilus]|uniref:Uncharacterized protein n=1 Tax=Neobacillus rhizophilus TaxID=2833579 RepID=A0A942U574_9BACI|nr:hypothetical protein [Neobacillus rhizophilus]MBS4214930.1 hypothetical protein [Neobacillus rhizophilus]
MTPTVQVIENLDNCWSDDIDVYEFDYYLENLVNEQNYLYVNFSEPGLEREIGCIDGETYYLIDIDDYEIEAEDEDSDIPEEVKPVKVLYLNETCSLGYLLKVDNGTLIIQSAIYYLHGKHFVGPCGFGSTTEIEVKEDVELFEQPMIEYIKKYKKD